MQPIVRVDTDEMSVEGGVMDFGERNPVGNDRLAEQLVLVRDYVGGVQQQWLGQARERTAAVIGSDHGLAERRLMQPLFDCPEGVAPFQRRLGRQYRLLIGHPERTRAFRPLGSQSVMKAGSIAW